MTPALESQTLSGLGCSSCGASAEAGKVQRLHKCEVISLSPLSVGGFTVESVWMTKGKQSELPRESAQFAPDEGLSDRSGNKSVNE